MSNINEVRNTGGRGKAAVRVAVATGLLALATMNAGQAQAQQAIGVPFIGKHHLSMTVTEMSRDGVGQERTSLFGGMYGNRLNGEQAAVKVHLLVRAAARALGDFEQSGIADAGVTLAATHAIPALGRLSVTGAAGVAAMVWSDNASAADGQDQNRIIAKVPLSAGLAYDLKVGRATISPFASVNGGYSTARNYLDETRVSESNTWRVGHTSGVSLRLNEIVMSISEIAREPGMPHSSRVAFAAGISW